MLMPTKGEGYGGSRDYCLPVIPCKVDSCPCNAGGFCQMPSAISINAAGECEQGKKAMEKPKEVVGG